MPKCNDECIVYLDFFQKKGVGIYDVYIDFRLERDLDLFVLSSDKNKSFGEINTYIELHNVKTNKRLRSGCYYKLNLPLINDLVFTPNQESLFLGRTYDCETMISPSLDVEELLQFHKQLDPMELIHDNPDPDELEHGLSNANLTLKVRNVDQANWNEVLEGNIIKLVYDIGAKIYANKIEVQRIFDSRRLELEQYKPILIISHWDMDHFHCLRYTDLNTIKECFSQFICIDEMKSLTSHNTYVKICKALGSENVYCIKPARPTNGIAMRLWKSVGIVSIYKGEKHKTNINYSGLCMFVKGRRKSVNFTGDVRLIQAKDVYDQELKQGINTNSHILIAPHHGGKNAIKNTVYSKPTTEVVISVGKGNKYGHPSKCMLFYLGSLCNNLYRTDICGDINISI